MKDLKKTDIEDIERQVHNYRCFMLFLKKNNLYRFFKEKMFIRQKRVPLGLMKTITEKRPGRYFGDFESPLIIEIDKRWAIVFMYLPYFGTYWDRHLDKYLLNLSGMDCLMRLHMRWQAFLLNNNYDKMKENNDCTFTFD